MTRRKSTKWEIRSSQDKNKIRTKEEIIDILLENREIASKDRKSFLSPNLNEIPDHCHLYNSKKAAKQILNAIEKDKKIFIHGDFDADGICATSLLWDFLYRHVARKLDKKVDVMPFIPSRVDDGYGLSENTISKLKADGADLIITVDCGVRDSELIKKYPEIEFIVTDHHQPDANFKPSKRYTLVHPMYPKHEYPQASISGTFVAFLLTQAISSELAEGSEIRANSVGLDLVALSTVTDIMPLVDVNRTVVYHGLEQIKQTTRVGLDFLMRSATISPSLLNSYHLGYVLGPRINAAGRIGDPMDGVRLLTTQDRSLAMKLAAEISNLNQARQKITDEILFEAEKQINEDDLVITVLGDDWSEGIVGLVAGKLMEKYNKPTLVMSKKSEIRGSARSLGGFNITQALESVSEHLLKFGGHAEAAGFTLEVDKYDSFVKAIRKIALKELKGKNLVRSKNIDTCLILDEISIDLILELMKLEPFGHKNPKPIFCFDHLEILEKKVIGSGKNHIKLVVGDERKNKIDCVMFNCLENIEELKVGDNIDFIGYLGVNEWQGTSTIQIEIIEWEEV